MAMNDRTLVRLSGCDENLVSIRTISRNYKSPHNFYLMRQKLIRYLSDEKKQRSTYKDSDIHSFIKIHTDHYKNKKTVVLDIYWISEERGNRISGYHETIELDCQDFLDFLRQSGSYNNLTHKMLSIHRRSQPRIIFRQTEMLKQTLKDKHAKKKLSRYLGPAFAWHNADLIEVYNDFSKYSFFFKETKQDGTPGICGGIIYHEQTGKRGQNMGRYEMHT